MTASTLTAAQATQSPSPADIAKTIAYHLTHNEHRGIGVLAAFVGGKHFCHGQEGSDIHLSFKHTPGGATGQRINYSKITLSAAGDDYTLELGYIRGMIYTRRLVMDGIGAEQLKGIWEGATGLYLSFK